jgi:hypothetical protein
MFVSDRRSWPRHLRVGFLVAILAAGVHPEARADLPRPDQEPCTGKQAGASCTYQGRTGTCTNRTCMRGGPGGPTSYECLLCETGGTAPDAAADAPADASPDATPAPLRDGAERDGSSGTVGTPDGSTSRPDGGGSGSSGTPDDDSGWCMIARRGRAGPWLIGGVFAALVLGWRRRRR